LADSSLRYPCLDEALEPTLKRLAFFAETHAPKGLYALDRLARRLGLPAERCEELLQVNQLLDTPAVEGLLSERVGGFDAAALSEGRVRALVDGAVFPLAYIAAVEWTRRRGLRDLIESYREVALARLSGLGHAWSIWCSFHELLPELERRADPQLDALCAERFAELVASQLATPASWPEGDEGDELGQADGSDDADPAALDLANIDDADFDDADFDGPEPQLQGLLEAVCCTPGFFGHSLITLAWVLRAEPLLSAAERRFALERATAIATDDSSFEATLEVEAPGDPERAISEDEYHAALTRLLDEGPKEVHTLTFADATTELWRVADGPRRTWLLAAIEGLRSWKLRREPSGERARD
jgi:hypothetical protein